MSINNKKQELFDEVKINLSQTDKNEIINSFYSDQSDLQNSINIKAKFNKPKERKNYIKDESYDSENYIEKKKGINYELVKKYESKIDELNNKINEIKKELKQVKKDNLEKEEELQDTINEKNKLERRNELELKRFKEKNSDLEDQNNKLISDYDMLKRRYDADSQKILQYKETYEKLKKLEKENKNLLEKYNILKEESNESKKRKIDIEKNYENLKLENMILNQNNNNLKKNINENEIKIKNQEEKISELEKDIKDMNKRNQNYIDKLTDKNLSLDNTYKDKITKELNEMRNRYENDILMLKKQYDDLSDQKTSYLKEERDEYRSKYNQCELMLKEKEECLNVTQTQLRDLISKSNAEVSNLKLKLNIKTEELNSKTAIYEEQMSSLAFYKNDNEALKEKNDILNREIIKLDAENRTKLVQYEIELRTAKEKLKLYEDAENKLDNLINLAPGEDGDNELVEIIKDTPSTNKRRINQNLTLATKVKMLSEENEKLRLVIDTKNNELQEMSDQCKIYKNIIDNVKQPNSYLITNLKDRETEIYRLRQEIINMEQENNKLKEECKNHVENINKMQNDMQKILGNRKQIDDLQIMLTNFIQKEKSGKNKYNDLDNMNNYVNSFNNNLNLTNISSLNHYATQQGFYNSASKEFRQQKPERDIDINKRNQKVSPPKWSKKLKKNQKK